jgi:hypothetical protein
VVFGQTIVIDAASVVASEAVEERGDATRHGSCECVERPRS